MPSSFLFLRPLISISNPTLVSIPKLVTYSALSLNQTQYAENTRQWRNRKHACVLFLCSFVSQKFLFKMTQFLKNRLHLYDDHGGFSAYDCMKRAFQASILSRNFLASILTTGHFDSSYGEKRARNHMIYPREDCKIIKPEIQRTDCSKDGRPARRWFALIFAKKCTHSGQMRLSWVQASQGRVKYIYLNSELREISVRISMTRLKLLGQSAKSAKKQCDEYGVQRHQLSYDQTEQNHCTLLA